MKNKKLKLPKERNPLVQHLIGKCGGGIHEKSFKSKRKQEKSDLKKKWLGQVTV